MNRSTSSSTLEHLLLKMGVNDFDIVRKRDIPHCRSENLIINLDDNGPGTHWVAMNRKHKLYFDPFGLSPPESVPKHYKHRRTIIEGIHDEDCGPLCALWLHYVNHKSPEAFFKLFRPLYV